MVIEDAARGLAAAIAAGLKCVITRNSFTAADDFHLYRFKTCTNTTIKKTFLTPVRSWPSWTGT
jgi:beta-phosphoglucomutase-like phosphatase (HAD superfamily)